MSWRFCEYIYLEMLGKSLILLPSPSSTVLRFRLQFFLFSLTHTVLFNSRLSLAALYLLTSP
jgi:hypothetical protein